MNAKLMEADKISQGQLQEGEKKSLSLIILGLFCIIHLLYAFWGPMNIMEGELLGSDGYTRLNRVQFIHEQGTWNNSVYPRSNAPYGESIHWTKPMDFLLLGGASIFSLVWPYPTSLHFWGVIISPLFHMLAFLGLLYLMRKTFDHLSIILLSVAFFLQPILTSYFLVGRPDHHSLILAIFCWFLVGVNDGLQNPKEWKNVFLIGGMGALGLWVSIEFFVPIALFLLVYGFIWIWRGDEMAWRLCTVMAGMCGFAFLFLFIERPGSSFFIVESDKISLVHCVLLGLITLVWLVMAIWERYATDWSTRWTRMGVLGVGTLVAVIFQWRWYPKFFQGPLADLDPNVKRLLWDGVSETQPLLSLNPLQVSDAMTSLGIGVIGILFLLYRMTQEPSRAEYNQLIIWMLGVCVFIPFAVYERRWTPYASVVMLVPYVQYIRKTVSWISDRCVPERVTIMTLMTTLGLLFGPVILGTVMALGEPQQVLSTVGGKCPLKPLGQYLSEQKFGEEIPSTILAFKDFGPELLYRTPHRFVATPMHRNHEGIRDMYGIMTDTNFDRARQTIQQRDINVIVVCVKSKAEERFYVTKAKELTFYEALVQGNHPKWLKEVALPQELQNSFRLFSL